MGILKEHLFKLLDKKTRRVPNSRCKRRSFLNGQLVRRRINSLANKMNAQAYTITSVDAICEVSDGVFIFVYPTQ